MLTHRNNNTPLKSGKPSMYGRFRGPQIHERHFTLFVTCGIMMVGENRTFVIRTKVRDLCSTNSDFVLLSPMLVADFNRFDERTQAKRYCRHELWRSLLLIKLSYNGSFIIIFSIFPMNSFSKFWKVCP